MHAVSCYCDSAYVYLESAVNHQREDAVGNLWAIVRDAQQVAYVRNLCYLILPLVWEVAGQQWVQGGRTGRNKGDQMPKEIMHTVVNETTGEGA